MSIQSESAAKEKRAAIVHELDQGLTDALAAGTFEEALHELALQSRLMVKAHQVAISYVPDGDFHRGIHTHSFSEKYEKYNTYDVMPTGDGIWGLVVKQRRSVRMTQAELLSHPLWRNFSDLKDARDLEHPPMVGWLAVPILSQSDGYLGVLQASDRYEGDFTEADLNLFTHLAKMISPTFELQYVNQELQRRTDELERFNRLAVGREQRMIELKREVNELAQAAGQPSRYDLSFADNSSQSDDS